MSYPGPRENPKSRQFRKRYYPSATRAQWNDWRWQLRNRITTLTGLDRLLCLSGDERAAITGEGRPLPLAVTPYYASLLDRHSSEQALRRTVIPTMNELRFSPGELDDPLGEDQDTPVPGLVHRYPDRVLFLVTGFCSTYCRYCTRSRLVGQEDHHRLGPQSWEKALAYIASRPSIRDVLLSGGDPLTLEDDTLEYLLVRLTSIPHVEIVRIGTKVPVVLPQRITVALVRMLRRYHPLWMSLHVTHPDELTNEVRDACERLAGAGIPLGSQTVLLRGVNDRLETMKELTHKLLRLRVRPYYLYQCDPIPGSSHFRTPVRRGLEIIRGLRGHTSGYAVPTFVIDAPGGGGKVPLLPNYVAEWSDERIVLRNYASRLYQYPDPGSGAALEAGCESTAAISPQGAIT